ncbi:MAG TPA: tripartite tricarboxylate transporter substrate binding protein [Burkholderiales bacterium]|nr:tripartite tricarboxylate transporter substrate binding protein [Burkholderiales bacterium]
MKKTVLFASALVGLAAPVSQPFAQSYPSKPVRWLVPTGAGSALDVVARRVAPKLGEALGQPVIVENKPGGNSVVAAREAARAAPDGHTLYQGVINNAINDVLTPDACCILNDKLLPVTRLISTSLVMVVHPSVPANSVKEYVALAKSKPNALTYASGGPGSITEMIGELLKYTTTIQVREIPYKAIGAEFPDLTGGHVQTAFLAPVVIRDAVATGKLRALAVADGQRVNILPGVPTMAEAGFAGVEGVGWNGIFVPAGTPAPIVQRLHKEIAAVLQGKEMKDDSANLGYRLGGEPPEEFAAFVRSEEQKWSKVIKDANIRVE